MVVKYICDYCGAKRILPKEMGKIVECVECDGFAVLEGSNALRSNVPDTMGYKKMRVDYNKFGEEEENKEDEE